jgi:hypothetical protein
MAKAPTPDVGFSREMSAILDPIQAAVAHQKSKVEIVLPYELRAIELGLVTAVRSWEAETLGLEKRTLPCLQALLQKVCSGKTRDLHVLQDASAYPAE